MVVHDGIPSAFKVPSQLELRQERRRSSRRDHRKRRDSLTPRNPTNPTVYNVLLYVLFCLSFFSSGARVQDAFGAMTERTSRKRQKLSEQDILELDEAFNVAHHALDHVFLPFATHADLAGDALVSLDVPFVRDTILQLERETIISSLPAKKREELRAPVDRLLAMLKFDRRLTV